MRRLILVCKAAYAPTPAALWFLVAVGGVHLMVGVACSLFFFGMSWIGPYLLNSWLLLALAAAYVVWIGLRWWSGLPSDYGHGFVLSAFGVLCRTWGDYVYYLSGFPYRQGGLSDDLEPAAVLFWCHRYLGLTAFFVGLVLESWLLWARPSAFSTRSDRTGRPLPRRRATAAGDRPNRSV